MLFIVLWDIAHAAYCNSWRVRNLLVKVLRLNESADRIVSGHTSLIGHGTNYRPFRQGILHSSRVVDNARVHPSQLPWIFMPNKVHLRQLAT